MIPEEALSAAPEPSPGITAHKVASLHARPEAFGNQITKALHGIMHHKLQRQKALYIFCAVSRFQWVVNSDKWDGWFDVQCFEMVWVT